MADESLRQNEVHTLRVDQQSVLALSVLIVALCGIVYELIIATISSYLLGDSVFQFSLTIGLFMFAMGLGSLITGRFDGQLLEWFVATEVVIAIVGGLSSILLFAVFPWTALYQPVMYTLILLVGGLVGLEIPLLIRVLSESGEIRQSVARVLALDYFGALLGSVAFPLILLPYLGLFRASFCIGLLNALIAAINIWVFRERLRYPMRWMAITVATIVLLVGSVASASWIMRFAEGQLYADHVIFSQRTPYQRIVVTRDEKTGEHRLYLDGHLQFAQRDEYRYHESLVHPVMGLPGEVRRVLVLGGGDGMVVRELLKYDQVETIELVDIDPAITQLSREFEPLRLLNQGSLESQRLTIYHEDAFGFVRERVRSLNRGEPGVAAYDRVIIDLPDPHNEALSKLYSVEFYRLVAKCLVPEGYFVTQSASPWVTRRAYWSVASTIEAAGFETISYHLTVPNFGVWGFHIGGHRSGMSDVELRVPTRYLTKELLMAASVFGKDEQRSAVVVNSIFEPRLYLLYHEGLSAGPG